MAVPLHVVRHGTPTEAPPLMIAHGLFGSARNWGVVAKRLSAAREVVAVDMRNHAASPWDDDHSYVAMADDLAAAMDGRAHDLLGHSMGGKAAMMAALAGAPVRRLVVADIAPVRYAHTQVPLIHAMRAVDPATVDRRSEAALDVAPEVRAFLLQSLDVAGRRWMLNLDALEASMEEIIGFPQVPGQWDGPALFLSGGDSDYVRREHRGRIEGLFPGARFAAIPGAGHWLHAEKPREFVAAVEAFLAA